MQYLFECSEMWIEKMHFYAFGEAFPWKKNNHSEKFISVRQVDGGVIQNAVGT